MDSEVFLSPSTNLAGTFSLVFWYLLINCLIWPKMAWSKF